MKKPVKFESFERLLEYGAWYISRYGISRKKLAFQLKRKAADESMVDEVLAKLDRFVDDRREIESRVLAAISVGQSFSDLRSKLLVKSFLREDIDAVFAKYENETSDFSNFRSAIEKRMRTLIARGYGPTRIESELRHEYPKFRDEIRSLVMATDSGESESAIEKFRSERDAVDPSDAKGRKKLFEKLVRRGFRVDEVRRFLAISEEEL